MFLCGAVFFFASHEKKEKLLWTFVFIIGVSLLFVSTWINVDIPEGSIGIDQNGNWYGSGNHLTLEKIWVISLKGSMPLWENTELLYDLTPEEVMSLERGSNFKERLKSETVISVQKMDMKIERTSEGINTSHLKVLISF